MKTFIKWICKKFAVAEEYILIKSFERDTHIYLDPLEQIKKEDRQKDYELER